MKSLDASKLLCLCCLIFRKVIAIIIPVPSKARFLERPMPAVILIYKRRIHGHCLPPPLAPVRMATVRSFLERPETIVHTTESNFFGRKKVKIVAILHGQICRATVVTKRNGTKVQSEKLSDGSQIITTT